MGGFLKLIFMNKTFVFVDGYNLYHSLMAHAGWDKYRWLDLKKLAEHYLYKQDELSKIFYFSAIAKWAPTKIVKHNFYIEALKSTGVDIVLGKFKKVTKICRAKCKRKYVTYEEKETDVNIALWMLKEAIANRYDKALIISGDSDLIPGIKTMRELFPQIRIDILVPRKGKTILRQGDSGSNLKEKYLKKSLLPNKLKLKNGKVITAPKGWA